MKKSIFIVTVGRYEFAPSWFSTLLMIFGVSLFISLGNWQLDRAASKKAALDAWTKQAQQPALPFATAVNPPKNNQTLILTGAYQADKQFLLDNKLYRQKTGYEVYSTFKLIDGRAVLINRGWLPAPPYRTQLPSIAVASGQLQLLARSYQRTQLPPVLGQVAETERWPVRIQVPDITLMAKLAKLDLALNTEMRLLPNQPGALMIASPVANITPNKSLGYAWQWFTFALVTILLWLFINNRAIEKK